MSYKLNRPSPSDSATLFAIGTIKKGNDGNKWQVVENINGIHKWKSMQKKNSKESSKKSSKKNLSKEKQYFNSSDMKVLPHIELKKIKKFKKIGSFNITKTMGFGDFDYTILNLKKGIYDAYQVDDNLMVVHSTYNELVKKDIESIKWKKYKFGALVDSGSFGFFNTQTIDQINLANDPKTKKINRIPYVEYVHNGFIVSTNMLENREKKKLPIELSNLKFGVISGTGTGDGFFDLYTHGRDMAILIGGFTSMKLYEENKLDDLLSYNLKLVKKHQKN